MNTFDKVLNAGLFIAAIAGTILVVGIVDAQRIVSKGSALMLDLTILSRGWRPKFQPKARRSRRLHAMNERGLGF